MDETMKSFVRIFARVVAVTTMAILLLIWAVFSWWPIPSALGKRDARIDISRGHYKELGYGLPLPGSNEYARLLYERYGIEFHYVGYCTVPKFRRDYADAYDEVSSAAVKRKFGRDVFKETYDEAAKNWKLTHPVKDLN